MLHLDRIWHKLSLWCCTQTQCLSQEHMDPALSFALWNSVSMTTTQRSHPTVWSTPVCVCHPHVTNVYAFVDEKDEWIPISTLRANKADCTELNGGQECERGDKRGTNEERADGTLVVPSYRQCRLLQATKLMVPSAVWNLKTAHAARQKQGYPSLHLLAQSLNNHKVHSWATCLYFYFPLINVDKGLLLCFRVYSVTI